MKIGDDINGYRIVTTPSNDNAGKCVWAFAERGGDEYFIKEFIELKRPRPSSMGDPESKRLQLLQCDKFESRHRAVMNSIDPLDLDAGNLVIAQDFFYEGTKYYKVTERLDYDTEALPHELSEEQRRVLLGTLTDSLTLLHRLNVVHGDLKPSNVLLVRPNGSKFYTAKLIDFDDSYIGGNPPERDEIVGDPLYGAPEYVRYMQGDMTTRGIHLTTAVDMFAIGLLLHVYITGYLPSYSEAFSSPADCVNAGGNLILDPRLHPKMSSLLRGLFARDPMDRPAVRYLASLLEADSVLVLQHARSVEGAAAPLGRLRINMKRGTHGTTSDADDTCLQSSAEKYESEPEGRVRPSRVRINFKPPTGS